MTRALIGFEESGRVREEFRRVRVDAWSCDILPAADGSPYHIQGDIRSVDVESYDLGIFFPPCDHLAVSGARWFEQKRADGRQQQGIDLFMWAVRACERIGCGAIENPIGIMSSLYRKPDQIIQPWQFGHGETKATCLWLFNLPPLRPTNIVPGRAQNVWRMAPGPHRKRDRARTFPGIAAAMAEQWASAPAAVLWP